MKFSSLGLIALVMVLQSTALIQVDATPVPQGYYCGGGRGGRGAKNNND
jgi:hypothetical protein